MKSHFLSIITALLVSLIAVPAGAQTNPGAGATGNGMGPDTGMAHGDARRAHPPRDCSQAPNPAACTAFRDARAKAQEACKDGPRGQRRQCMHEQLQNFDCSKAANPEQCESRKMAYKECQDQAGPAFRQCVRQKMPPIDCSKAASPSRCEQHQKARDACQGKTGPDHKTCMREQLHPR